MTVYNKLVRDKIPEIIQNGGEMPNYRILEREAYLRCLEEKLDEEVQEYHRDKTAEELADILEVVFALADEAGYDMDAILELRGRKKESRGGFSKRIFLISKT